MNKPTVIGLCGPAGCGKSAAGEILRRIGGYSETSFAEALRREVSEVTELGGLIPEEIRSDRRLAKLNDALVASEGTSPWEKPTPPAMRTALQMWGTEFRRHQDPDYWVKIANLDPPTVVTDCRFPNEVKRIRDLGGVLWWIARPGLQVSEHISERLLGPWNCDRLVNNSGSLEDFEERLASALAAPAKELPVGHLIPSI